MPWELLVGRLSAKRCPCQPSLSVRHLHHRHNKTQYGHLPDFSNRNGPQELQGRMTRTHYLMERMDPSSTHSQPLPKDLEGKPLRGRITRQDLECIQDIEKMVRVMFHFPLCTEQFTSFQPLQRHLHYCIDQAEMISWMTILFRESKLRIWKPLSG
jgi:hypothetical protein